MDFNVTALMALSAIDGRYDETAARLRPYMSEYGLIKYRLLMQAAYLIALSQEGVLPRRLSEDEKTELLGIADITQNDACIIRTIETTGYADLKATRHDVVAALTWLRMQMQGTSMKDLTGWVHFGLTSEDCNNIAYAMMLRDAIRATVLPDWRKLVEVLMHMARKYAGVSMLARTHGQAATPTTLGKEFRVFAERLTRQLHALEEFRILVKLNGASGNHCALRAAFPNTDWPDFSRHFVLKLNGMADGGALQFAHNPYTTQIEPHDTYAELFGIIMRFNTILVDACQDFWRYISDDYLVQPAVEGEVGSSAMPHKVNPIDFENAEGNLLFANAIMEFFNKKLPISRLQRDLSDSTVERNFGLVLGHCLHSYKSALRGLGKVSANEQVIAKELQDSPEVLAEAYQTILRREGIPDAYDKMKGITRGKAITYEHLGAFIHSAGLPEKVRAELAALTPASYIGFAKELAQEPTIR